MSQEVLYRKWRPQRFADVAGQAPIVTTLRHAVAGASPAHAYLFTGPRGTGKTTTGRILAKAVNCLAPQDGEPCDVCASCEAFLAGRALDLIELDAASNRGIDEVRALREAAGYSPNVARYKVYLVDEVHMLTDPAFNALLKTLEEPPPHVIFVLATTEPHRIPATITSRCQRFDFRRIALVDVVARLQTIAAGEGFDVPPAALELIARQATGSLRDAVGLLDQLVAYHGPALDVEAVQRGLGLVGDRRTIDLARAVVTRDLGAGLAVLAAARDDGLELRAFVREAVGALRQLLLLKAGAVDLRALPEVLASELQPLAAQASAPALVAALRTLGAVDFAGDPYDALPAEIAFASVVVAPEPVAAAAPPPGPAPAARAARPAPPRPAPAQPRPPAPRATSPAGAAAMDRDPQQRAEPRPEPRGEPRPAPQFVPPDADAASPELAALRQQWPRIREGARQRHHKAGALLNTACYIKSVDGDSIELGFRFPTHVEKAREDQRVMDAIREAVSEAAGRPLTVSAVVWEALAQAPAPAAAVASATAAPAAPPPSGGHLFDEALQRGAVPLDD